LVSPIDHQDQLARRLGKPGREASEQDVGVLPIDRHDHRDRRPESVGHGTIEAGQHPAAQPDAPSDAADPPPRPEPRCAAGDRLPEVAMGWVDHAAVEVSLAAAAPSAGWRTNERTRKPADVAAVTSTIPRAS